MKKLVVSWVPSVSADVEYQEFVLVANGVEYPPVNLDPSISGWSSDADGILFEEGGSATVSVTAVDAAGNRSETVSATAVNPDVTAPAPITGLTLTFEDAA